MRFGGRCSEPVLFFHSRVVLIGLATVAVWMLLCCPGLSQEDSPKPKKPSVEVADDPGENQPPGSETEESADGEESEPAEPAAKKPPAKEAAEPPLPPKKFYEQEQYDLVTLDAANDNAVLKVLPLQLPDRKLPDPSKRIGRLKVRLFDKREEEYEVMWRNIVQVDFFEELVLREAEQTVQRAAQLGRAGNHAESQKQFDEAYDFFRWLMIFHPNVAGLEKAIQDYLYLNAGTLFLIGAQYETDAAGAADASRVERLKKQAFDKFAQALAILEELVGMRRRAILWPSGACWFGCRNSIGTSWPLRARGRIV